MAVYTMELREVLQKTELFDFEYEMDESYIDKDTLENLIISRYYFNEIGSETIDRFKHIFRQDYLQKLIVFIEELKYYGEMVGLNANSVIKYRSITSNDTIGKSIQATPMSNTAPADRYASQRDITSSNTSVSENWNDMTAIDFYKEINKQILPLVSNFIESLSDNFMGVY